MLVWLIKLLNFKHNNTKNSMSSADYGPEICIFQKKTVILHRKCRLAKIESEAAFVLQT